VPISVFLEQWTFFREAVLGGAMSGAVLGALGVYLVARRMVFFSATLTQVSGLGVIASLVAWQAFTVRFLPELAHEHEGHALRVVALTIGAFLFSGAGALVLARATKRSDQMLAFAWIVATAGILLLGIRVDRHEIPNITLWMFSGRGEAGLLPHGDFARLVSVNAAVLALHVWWVRGFSAITFDPLGARVRGLPVRVLDAALLLSLAAATSVGGAVLGMLPVFAYSVLPSFGAIRVAPNVPTALALAAAVGAVASVTGYVAAFVWSLPVGATQALAAALLAGALAAIGRLSGR
jgi:ABC-type Mn2+/Zn2+ transport system permease subunit